LVPRSWRHHEDISFSTATWRLLHSFMAFFFLAHSSRAVCVSAVHMNWMPSRANWALVSSTNRRRFGMSTPADAMCVPALLHRYFIVRCM